MCTTNTCNRFVIQLNLRVRVRVRDITTVSKDKLMKVFVLVILGFNY